MNNENELPQMPLCDATYNNGRLYSAETMRTYAAACYALGRGAAVREYIESGAFKQPQGEAVPAKVASIDSEEFQNLLHEYRRFQTGDEMIEVIDHINAWHNAKLAEAREGFEEISKGRERHWLQQNELCGELMNAAIKRAEKAEAERDQWKAQHADMVKRCAILRERDDLPVDRIPAYQELVRLQALAAQVPQAGQAPDVVEMLLNVCHLAFELMDNTEEIANRLGLEDAEYVAQGSDFEALSDAINEIEILPDDQPGYVMGPAAKARWAMRAGWPAIPQQAGQAVDGVPGFTPKLTEAQRAGLMTNVSQKQFNRELAAPPASAAPVGQVKK